MIYALSATDILLSIWKEGYLIMKRDKIIYLIQVRVNGEILLQEKEGFLIRIESIEPGEYLYFIAAHDIDK